MVALQNDAAGLNSWLLICGIGLGVEIVTIAYVSELAPKACAGAPSPRTRQLVFVAVPVVSFLAYMLVRTAPLGIEGWRWVVLIGVAAAPVVVFLRGGLPESPRWLPKAWEARRGGPGFERDRSKGRGRVLPAAAGARP
jgi:MFS transporter, putative metabolite:H+ symporter